MKKLPSRIMWIFISVYALFTQSCIDNKYNLDNLPSKFIVAGDSLTLPLGKSDSVLVKKFLADQDFQYLENRNGVFYITYKDSINLNLPTDEELKIADINKPDTVSSMISGAPLNTPIPFASDFTNISKDSTIFPVNTGTIIERLDYVKLKQGTNYARLACTIKLQDISLISGNGRLSVNMQIPQGLELTPDAGQIVNNQYNINIQDLKQLPKTYYFTIKSLTRNDQSNLIFGYNCTTTINAGSVIKYTSNKAGIGINILAQNLYADYIVGKINYSQTSTGLKADISDIYKLFKNQSDSLNFYNPVMYLKTKSNIGIPLALNLTTQAVKNGITLKSDVTTINLEGATTSIPVKTNSFALSSISPSNLPSGTTWKALSLDQYIKVKPTYIGSDIFYQPQSGSGTKANPHFIPSSPFANVTYKIDMPIAFANGFQLNYTDTIADVFEKDMTDYITESGSLKITGNVVTDIPLDATVSIAILSEDPNQSPLTLSSTPLIKAVKGQTTSTPFTVSVKDSDLKNFISPRHLKISIKLNTNNDLQGVPIKDSNFIYVENMRAILKGGIVLNLK